MHDSENTSGDMPELATTLQCAPFQKNMAGATPYAVGLSTKKQARDETHDMLEKLAPQPVTDGLGIGRRGSDWLSHLVPLNDSAVGGVIY
jgi:hypothetical protein